MTSSADFYGGKLKVPDLNYENNQVKTCKYGSGKARHRLLHVLLQNKSDLLFTYIVNLAINALVLWQNMRHII